MRQIAIYGGSFDPPTLGHVMVITHLLLNEPEIDENLIIPCFQQSGKNLQSFDHRYRMCEMSFGWLPKVKLSRIEQEMGGESVTLRTLRELQHSYYPPEEYRLRFVMGSDLLETAPLWEGWDEIKKLAPPLVVGRAGIQSPNGPTPISPFVSSSIVRSSLAGRNYAAAKRYIGKNVLEYIQIHQLYRSID